MRIMKLMFLLRAEILKDFFNIAFLITMVRLSIESQAAQQEKNRSSKRRISLAFQDEIDEEDKGQGSD